MVIVWETAPFYPHACYYRPSSQNVLLDPQCKLQNKEFTAGAPRGGGGGGGKHYSVWSRACQAYDKDWQAAPRHCCTVCELECNPDKHQLF